MKGKATKQVPVIDLYDNEMINMAIWYNEYKYMWNVKGYE